MTKRALLIALFLLAVSGLMLHYRIHPFLVADKIQPGKYNFEPTEFLASLLPFVDVILVTVLFISRKTVVYGYLLNGIIIIYGTVFMAHFSISLMIAKSIPLSEMFLKSTLPDIGIAWGDFFIGKALYDLYTKN